MTRKLFVVATLAFGLAGLAWAKGKDDAAKPPAAEEKLTGEVLDLNCYVGHGAQGEKHAACAQKCIAGGAPVGLLADAKVYVLTNGDHSVNLSEKLSPLAGKKVTVTGHAKILEGGGHAFDVSAVEAAK